MNLDSVQDIQQTFRTLIDVSSFPGKVVSLKEDAEKINLEMPLSRGLMLLCLTLLDGEVSFYCSGEKEKKLISQMTYSKAVSLEDADFIIPLHGDSLSELISRARPGTLLDPHLGATILLEVEKLDQDNGPWVLQGPGIKESRRAEIVTSETWVEARKEANREFPLGVDFYLLDRECRVMALPRTTQIRRSA